MSLFIQTLTQELRIGLRNPGQIITVCAFFVLTIILFPLALGPSMTLMKSIAPGLLTTTALLAACLPLEHIFSKDKQDGTLDGMLSSASSMSFYVAGKILAIWCLTGLPLTVMAPFIALALGMGQEAAWLTFIVFLPMTALLSLVGATGSSLVLGSRKTVVLLALIIFPFYSPILIFGAGCLNLVQAEQNHMQPLSFLWAMLAAALPIIPLLCSRILQWQIRD